MSIQFGSVPFKRNGVLASGILGVTGWSMAEVARQGAGGITCKSISREKRKGHKTPCIQAYPQGLLNAVGLSSTGVENSNKELQILRDNSDAVIIASVFGATEAEFAATIELLDEEAVDIIELNISCPNVHDEFGLPFSAEPATAAQVVKACRDKTDKMLLAKLSPNFPRIGEIAKACEAAGADGITAINTVGPGMMIDLNTFRPKLTNKCGGVSGPAILPIAVRCIHDIAKSVSVPIIGAGGITTAEDALQVIAAGATLYSVGTGILYGGPGIFADINRGIEDYLAEKKISYDDLVGIVQKM